jgi:hypothetical protein
MLLAFNFVEASTQIIGSRDTSDMEALFTIKEQMEMEAHMQQLPQLAKRLKALEEKRGTQKPGVGNKEKKK